MELEYILAICLMPLSMLIAAQGWVWMTLVFVSFPLLLLWYYYKVLYAKKRSRFFIAWITTSFFFLMGILELEVVPYLEILFSENLACMCFIATTCIFIYFVKSNSQPASFSAHAGETMTKTDLQHRRTRCEVCSTLQPLRTYHCDLCGYCVHKRDHHSVWLDICIGSRNHKYYMGALVALLFSTVYGSLLALTTICHPVLVFELFLLPDDCSDVFGDIHMGICFVSAIYTMMMGGLGLYLFFLQLWLISYNSTYLEWKQGQLGTYSKGICQNIINFVLGRP